MHVSPPNHETYLFFHLGSRRITTSSGSAYSYLIAVIYSVKKLPVYAVQYRFFAV
jgi:hypothetical protein